MAKACKPKSPCGQKHVLAKGLYSLQGTRNSTLQGRRKSSYSLSVGDMDSDLDSDMDSVCTDTIETHQSLVKLQAIKTNDQQHLYTQECYVAEKDLGRSVLYQGCE